MQFQQQLGIDYSRITFAEFLFCTSIPETLSISLKADKEIRNFVVFRKLIRTFSIQKNCVQAMRKNTLMRLEKYPTVPHFLSSNFMQMNAQRLCEHAQMYHDCSLWEMKFFSCLLLWYDRGQMVIWGHSISIFCFLFLLFSYSY